MSTAKEGVGMRPSELLLVALGACSAVDVVGILQKKRIDLRGLDIKISGEQDPDPPWTYRKIHVEYILRGKGLTDRAVQQALHLSEKKYCSVSTTVSGVAAITQSYQILEDGDA